MTRVEILVLDRVSPSSLALTLEVLDIANRLQRRAGAPAPFDTKLTGLGRELEGPRPDLLVAPGPRADGDLKEVEAWLAGMPPAALARLAFVARAGTQVASCGAGVFMMAAAGLLDGRRATTSSWLAGDFRRRFPAVDLRPESNLVIDGHVATGAAPLAQLDLMLVLVSRHAGADLARRCAERMFDRPRNPTASGMGRELLTGDDEQIVKAELWALDRLGDRFDVDALAAAVGLGARTFARRLRRATGLSPVRFVQRLRARQAVDLLSTTRLPFDEIARRVGYAEPSTLRRLLRRDMATGAREIRAELGMAGA